jgi:hypothetical protein
VRLELFFVGEHKRNRLARAYDIGLFGKKRDKSTGGGRELIAGHLIAQLPDLGRATFGNDPQHRDVSEYYLQPFLDAGAPTEDPAWSAFVDKFLAELNDGAVRLGGWANPGAFYVAKDFVKSDDWAKPAAIDVMDRALKFLAEVDSNGMAIPMFALSRWDEIRNG